MLFSLYLKIIFIKKITDKLHTEKIDDFQEREGLPHMVLMAVYLLMHNIENNHTKLNSYPIVSFH